ncbi:hypothetical protein EEZ25_33220 [Micromonospora aurantiaca]|uniref:hypothetical protein n=1 Tax=Micromonospora aurantiaca (nom. illeg.) TaxID=47850 RepID=UPI000F3DE9CF|nr:hypothetical protein [Micromonospora aurantiaca]RNH93525.1 hypothetical protein EEZ25_33220 [Micromonospora aurantiaca]
MIIAKDDTVPQLSRTGGRATRDRELYESLDRPGALLDRAPGAVRGFALWRQDEVRSQVREYREFGVVFTMAVLDPTDPTHLHIVGTTLQEAMDG